MTNNELDVLGARHGGEAGRTLLGRTSLPRLAVPLICLAQLMATLDVTIVNLALPSIQRDLTVSDTGLAWVVDAYILAYAGLLLVGGRMGDLVGRRRTLLAGVAIFTSASLLAALASGLPVLLVARAGQGIGAALATPTTLSMITTLVPAGPARTRAMVAYGAMAGLGITLGLVLGGVLTEAASWRWVFWLNVPIGLVVLAFAPRILPESRGGGRRLDLPGAAVGTVSLTLLVFGIIRAGEHTWTDPLAWVPMALSLGGLIGFAALERAVPEPTLPLPLLRHRVRLGAYLVAGLMFACLYPSFLLLSRTLQDVQSHGPIAAGLRFLPIGIGVLVFAVLARKLMTVTGPAPLVVLGAFATAVGAVLLTALDGNHGYSLLLLALVGLGAGVGTTFVANAALSMTDVPEEDAGIAAGLLSTFQAVGGTVGVAALASAAASRAAAEYSQLPSPAPPGMLRDALMSGFDFGFLLAAGIAVAAVAGAVATARFARTIAGGVR